ncbi:FAD-dependent oxidoreductase [Streptomyces sp. SLBN-118]|uniref:FAD-dependent oxidoreductase n=1 Tax=Streptomyces sp. SLBN-118 TaxID=2768454 RepID=UPI0028C50A24|nr:FAD-dependent oxidoreductase [Streptomyces sp. SLBN-118]
MHDHVTPRRVVVLGGGFAGLFAARALRRSPVAVTVVDRCAHPSSNRCSTSAPPESCPRVRSPNRSARFCDATTT